MAVPKRRTSRSKQGMRRAHHFITPMQIQYCPNCEQPILPHRVCSNCGHYQGREAIPPEEKKEEK
jgi:large subunit ribosomal protein L32